jgi:hypothetical protein
VRDSRYQGSFDHPVRAFLIGVTLLVLLFGGFAVGIEAGTHPIEQAGATERVVTMTGRTKTVSVSAHQKLIEAQVRVIRLPGSVENRVVVIHRKGKTFFAAIQPASVNDFGLIASASTVTVSTPPDTVISTVTETETTTVTETAPSTSDSSGSTSTGP